MTAHIRKMLLQNCACNFFSSYPAHIHKLKKFFSYVALAVNETKAKRNDFRVVRSNFICHDAMKASRFDIFQLLLPELYESQWFGSFRFETEDEDT